MSTRHLMFAAGIALAFASTAGAQSTTPAPAPCRTDPERRLFDFWVGDWDVTPSGAAVVVGTSSVQVVSGGCALLENWTSARGGQGKSLNAYNVAEQHWQQYWIGQDGSVVEFRDSEWRDGSVTFLARFAAHDTTPATVMRLTFTPRPDSTVRQHGEQSTDGGATWKTQYDFIYRRRR